MKKIILFIAGFCILSYLLGLYLGSPRSFDDPVPSTWLPKTKNTGWFQSEAIPDNQRFYTLHGDTHNSDELSIVASPAVALDWTTETDMFIAEGPTEDTLGNLYFSPIGPKDNVILVSLDPGTGARRWAIPANGKLLSAGGGAPLILNDPVNSDQQIIYLGVYDRAVAVRPSGDIIWDVATGLQEPVLKAGELDGRHVFGLNYHPQADALVGLTAAGDIYVLDRASGKPLLDNGCTSTCNERDWSRRLSLRIMAVKLRWISTLTPKGDFTCPRPLQ